MYLYINYIAGMGALLQACETVRNSLTSGLWSPGERLPPLADLAKLCGVSRTTMWKALGILQQEKVLYANRGGAIIAGPHSDLNIEESRRDCAWERLKAQIGQDIIWGVFAQLRLPPMNKLALHYGVAIDTLKKALNELVRDDLLARVGRNFEQVKSAGQRRQQTIVLITASDKNGEISIGNDYRTEQILNCFEREGLRSGFSARCVGFSYGDNAVLETSTAVRNIADVGGFIINLWKPYNEIHWQRWLDLIHFLIGRRVPVAIIDQLGTLSLPKEFYQWKNLRILHLSGVRAGELVGRALLRAGHKRVAYIKHSEYDWASLRYAGLARYYQQYGGAATSVELLSLGDITNDDDLVVALLNLDTRDISDLFRERLSRSQIQGYLDMFQSKKWLDMRKKVPSNTATRNIQLIAKFLRNLVRASHDRWIFDQELGMLQSVASAIGRDWHMRALFKTVLEKSTASAWVCQDDGVAIAAIPFLRSQGWRVPDDISVFGFDNWRIALENQLSSYDFNMTGMVQHALQLIMDEKVLKNTPMIGEVDGYVVERATTKN
jgi:DNA-binding GntR family transcriptional regulator